MFIHWLQILTMAKNKYLLDVRRVKEFRYDLVNTRKTYILNKYTKQEIANIATCLGIEFSGKKKKIIKEFKKWHKKDIAYTASLDRDQWIT